MRLRPIQGRSGFCGSLPRARKSFSGNQDNDASFATLIEQVRAATPLAVADVVTCELIYLLLGMSSESFWNGREITRPCRVACRTSAVSA